MIIPEYTDNKYKIIKKYRPNIIALGYDQFVFTYKLQKILIDEKMDTEIIRLNPYMPDIYKSTLIKVQNEQLPPDGVWKVSVKVGDCWLAGIGNLGRRPTVENDVDAQRLLEVHLFDFAADLYGMELTVRFEDYIRPEMKFDGIEALKVQIGRDVDLVRGLFKQYGTPVT